MSEIIPWMEIADARGTIGEQYLYVPDEDKALPPMSYFLKGVWDWHTAGAKRVILSSSPDWMDGTWGELHKTVYQFLPAGMAVIAGIRPLDKHLKSMLDVEGWTKQPIEQLANGGPVVLDMEVIFDAGRFESFDLGGWYQSLLTLPKEVVIWWNLPSILPSSVQSPTRQNDTMMMCRLIRWVRPNDKIMDASVAYVVVDSPRRALMVDAMGIDNLLDRIIVAPDSEPYYVGNKEYYLTSPAIDEVESQGDRPQIIWTDVVRWTRVAREWAEAVTG